MSGSNVSVLSWSDWSTHWKLEGVYLYFDMGRRYNNTFGSQIYHLDSKKDLMSSYFMRETTNFCALYVYEQGLE